MTTKNIIILTVLILGGLMMNQAAFSAQLPQRLLPVSAIRATPVPRPKATPTPAPDAIAISYQTSAASNIAINVTAGQAGAPAGFFVQWMTLGDYVALGNQWPETLDVPNPPPPTSGRPTFPGVVRKHV